MNDTNDIMLSIYVATYNHEKYITKALDSILMQKTKYNFEVLVGEDLSTDSTRSVLKEYEKQHPNKFQIFYREKNMHNTECNNSQDLMFRCKGKYIIALEGDDFWIDENKIEKQIDFLENHPEYIAVSHKCVVVGEDSQPNGETYQQCEDEEYTFKHFFSEIMPGQLATVMYRNPMKDSSFDCSILEKKLSPGDRLLYFALLCHGKVFCIQETMSAYRHITTHGSSFSASFRMNYFSQKEWYDELINYAEKHTLKKHVKICIYQKFYGLVYSFLRKQMTFGQFLREFVSIPYKFSIFFITAKRLFNKKILHKKLYS